MLSKKRLSYQYVGQMGSGERPPPFFKEIKYTTDLSAVLLHLTVSLWSTSDSKICWVPIKLADFHLSIVSLYRSRVAPSFTDGLMLLWGKYINRLFCTMETQDGDARSETWKCNVVPDAYPLH